ncbi:MAG TPA: hypothetical protein VF407_21670, partial [Polyangiaceae bacterium]
DVLLDRARRRRAQLVSSPIRELDQRARPLRAFVDALIEAPLVDGTVGSPYPLELTADGARSLVIHACVEARRGGMPWIMVTQRPEGTSLFAAAAREACAAPGEPATIVESRLRAELGAEDVEAIVVLAEHGMWACCGIEERDRFVAVHAAEPAMVDALARKLAEASR